MTSENFVYWLQGYLELSDPKKGLTMKQVDMIEEHLKLVMDKVTPLFKDWPYPPVNPYPQTIISTKPLSPGTITC